MQTLKKSSIFRTICLLVSVAVFMSTSGVLNTPGVQASPLAYMPEPTQLVNVSSSFNLPTLRGIRLDKDNPFRFEFMLDEGSRQLQEDELRREAATITKYFLAALTIPDEDLWVNLSPYEQDRISTRELGITDLGKDLLGQDYVLKQLTSSLTYPESELGRKFWNEIYNRVGAALVAAQDKRTGTSPVSTPDISTFNKIWISPKKVHIYETKDRAVISEATFKVMLEEDYLAMQKGLEKKTTDLTDAEQINQISSDAMREIILPIIEEEVNNGEHFAPLRQLYCSVILASWFKTKLKDNVLDKAYVDKRKTAGTEAADRKIKEKIYNQYVEAFKKGIYDYIRKDIDPVTKRKLRRRYFSGGCTVDTRGARKVEKVDKIPPAKEPDGPRIIEDIRPVKEGEDSAPRGVFEGAGVDNQTPEADKKDTGFSAELSVSSLKAFLAGAAGLCILVYLLFFTHHERKAVEALNEDDAGDINYSETNPVDARRETQIKKIRSWVKNANDNGGDTDEYISKYNDLLESEDDEDAYKALGDICVDIENIQYAQRLRLIKKIVSRYRGVLPNPYQARFLFKNLGKCLDYLEGEDFEELIDILDDIASANPQDILRAADDWVEYFPPDQARLFIYTMLEDMSGNAILFSKPSGYIEYIDEKNRLGILTDAMKADPIAGVSHIAEFIPYLSGIEKVEAVSALFDYLADDSIHKVTAFEGYSEGFKEFINDTFGAAQAAKFNNTIDQILRKEKNKTEHSADGTMGRWKAKQRYDADTGRLYFIDPKRIPKRGETLPEPEFRENIDRITLQTRAPYTKREKEVIKNLREDRGFKLGNTEIRIIRRNKAARTYRIFGAAGNGRIFIREDIFIYGTYDQIKEAVDHELRHLRKPNRHHDRIRAEQFNGGLTRLIKARSLVDKKETGAAGETYIPAAKAFLIGAAGLGVLIYFLFFNTPGQEKAAILDEDDAGKDTAAETDIGYGNDGGKKAAPDTAKETFDSHQPKQNASAGYLEKYNRWLTDYPPQPEQEISDEYLAKYNSWLTTSLANRALRNICTDIDHIDYNQRLPLIKRIIALFTESVPEQVDMIIYKSLNRMLFKNLGKCLFYLDPPEQEELIDILDDLALRNMEGLLSVVDDWLPYFPEHLQGLFLSTTIADVRADSILHSGWYFMKYVSEDDRLIIWDNAIRQNPVGGVYSAQYFLGYLSEDEKVAAVNNLIDYLLDDTIPKGEDLHPFMPRILANTVNNEARGDIGYLSDANRQILLDRIEVLRLKIQEDSDSSSGGTMGRWQYTHISFNKDTGELILRNAVRIARSDGVIEKEFLIDGKNLPRDIVLHTRGLNHAENNLVENLCYELDIYNDFRVIVRDEASAANRIYGVADANSGTPFVREDILAKGSKDQIKEALHHEDRELTSVHHTRIRKEQYQGNLRALIRELSNEDKAESLGGIDTNVKKAMRVQVDDGGIIMPGRNQSLKPEEIIGFTFDIIEVRAH